MIGKGIMTELMCVFWPLKIWPVTRNLPENPVLLMRGDSSRIGFQT